jgi:starch synthase (maltosyl-transferring)
MQARSNRIAIEAVTPEIDSGRFAIKRVLGDKVSVSADIFADGHDVIRGVLRFRHEAESEWTEVPLKPLVNDRWQAEFVVARLGRYYYTVQAWIDTFQTWRRNLSKKIELGEDSAAEYVMGAQIMESAARRIPKRYGARLLKWAAILRRQDGSLEEKENLALSPEVNRDILLFSERDGCVSCSRELPVVVDRAKARFSAWYELFPRSASPEAGRHGTLTDCIALLPYVADMGFDVLYLPPIHPIGSTHRRGKDNRPQAEPDDVGSPWAIGAVEGGHKSIHPQLGTIEDFDRLVEKAQECGIEIALDIAFQCSPDHPYVKQHPEWFHRRPDGGIQYAENPPKKYRDIYPFDFDCEDWQGLWEELKGIFLFWIEHGIRIFRVDNPHTKPFEFWHWVISEIKIKYPETIFLAEAFTRPKVMYRLAKLGFTQSYTYFAWRNTQYEIAQYFQELAQSSVREFFRPNLWPNTPDILTEYLQFGGRPAFMARAILAATLGASYGIYGPAFELCENLAREPGSEEYAHSEKYEIRHWERDRMDSLKDFIGRLNQIRRSNPALHTDANLMFHAVDNDQLICYSKHSEDFGNIILVIVNLDPHHRQAGWIDLDLASLGLDVHNSYQAHDLMSEARFLWQGPRNYVELNPQIVPAHVLVIRRRQRTEKQFDYYL